MLWFNCILGLNFIFFCFKLIIIHNHTQEQKKMKFNLRLNKTTTATPYITKYIIFYLLRFTNFEF